MRLVNGSGASPNPRLLCAADGRSVGPARRLGALLSVRVAQPISTSIMGFASASARSNLCGRRRKGQPCLARIVHKTQRRRGGKREA
jgi:hypothetical protein